MADTPDIRELRQSYETLKAAGERDQTELAELRAENQILKAQGFGLNEAQARAFAQANPETVTAETVQDWAKGLGLNLTPAPTQTSPPTAAPPMTTEPTSGQPSVQSPPNPGMTLIGGAGTRAGDGGQLPTGTEMMTTDELTQLARTDPVAAEKAIREGRVQLSENNFYVKAGLIKNPV